MLLNRIIERKTDSHTVPAVATLRELTDELMADFGPKLRTSLNALTKDGTLGFIRDINKNPMFYFK